MDWNDMNADQTPTGNSSSATTATYFNQYYFSYPLSHIAKDHLETGNKIIMPPSALDQLASLTVVYPMLFRIENTTTGRHSHCGVLEFTADEGFVFLPTWMMKNMQLREGDLVNIKNAILPKGDYMKIQPHATKFTTIPDHKSLLEKAFREISCLTTGDTIVVNHGEEKYKIDIVETKPSPAISLFETDCEVDFAPPLDYKEPEKRKTTADIKRKNTTGDEDRKNSPRHSNNINDDDDTTIKESKAFPGVGRRLGGTHVPSDNDNCCLHSELSMKKLKITESTMAVDRKLKNKQQTEFKPFVGMARRIDGEPSLAAVAVAVEEAEQGQSKTQVNVKEKDEGFKVFTGKSFRLG